MFIFHIPGPFAVCEKSIVNFTALWSLNGKCTKDVALILLSSNFEVKNKSILDKEDPCAKVNNCFVGNLFLNMYSRLYCCIK